MIKHLFKLVWNRKRVNFLISVEIFFSFLVLFVLTVLSLHYYSNYRRPLGFSYENVWNISIDLKQMSDDYWSNEQVETTRQLLLTAQQCPEVEAAGCILSAPFSFSSSHGVWEIDGRRIEFERNEVTDSIKDVLNIELTRGRWFSKEDNGANYEPVIINEYMAEQLFGNADPLGKNASHPKDKIENRIIGVMKDFRKDGEFAGKECQIFFRRDLSNPKHRPGRNLIIRVKPGTSADFEAKLMASLQSVAKQWSFEMETSEQMRETSIRVYITPVVVASIISCFLLIMVALGLTGVLWQNVTQRTKEIGLRRAIGAAASNIHRQIIGEMIVIAFIALGAGTALVLQFPLLDLIGSISRGVFITGLVLSHAVIYLITIACSLYPSLLATKVDPAVALHYE